MKTQFVRLACIVAVCTGVSTAAYGQDATLKYRWVEGEQIRYRHTQESSTTMTGMPGLDGMAITQKMIQVLRMTVEKVAPDGSVTLRETFESVRVEQNNPMGKTVFDSTVPANPDQAASPIDPVMNAMVGESITIVMAPDGKVTKVEGMSRIMEKAFGSLPQNPLLTQLLGELKATMSDEAMATTLGQGFAAFPNRALKSGDTWTSQADVNTPIIGVMTTSTAYTLKSLESTNGVATARIAQTQTMKQGGQAPASALNALGMNMKLGDSKSQGEILFDVTRGRLQKSSVDSDMSMTMSLENSPAGSLTMTASVRTTMLMELLEK